MYTASSTRRVIPPNGTNGCPETWPLVGRNRLHARHDALGWEACETAIGPARAVHQIVETASYLRIR